MARDLQQVGWGDAPLWMRLQIFSLEMLTIQQIMDRYFIAEGFHNLWKACKAYEFFRLAPRSHARHRIMSTSAAVRAEGHEDLERFLRSGRMRPSKQILPRRTSTRGPLDIFSDSDDGDTTVTS